MLLVSHVAPDAGPTVEGTRGVDTQRVFHAVPVAHVTLVDVIALLALPSRDKRNRIKRFIAPNGCMSVHLGTNSCNVFNLL